MTDLEMVELAAWAAGILPLSEDLELDYTPDTPGLVIAGDGTYRQRDPLTDDGDALRLAVQCGIEFSIVDDEPGNDGRTSRACAGYCVAEGGRIQYVFEDHRGDLFAATRRAIVRAAAEIGKAMKTAGGEAPNSTSHTG